MKLTLLLLTTILCANFAQADIREQIFKDGSSENAAIQRAYWELFELALEAEMSDLMADSPATRSFKADFNENFDQFKDNYFKDTLERCSKKKVGDAYKCSVLATVKMTKVKVAVKNKSRDNHTGKSRLGSHKIVILRNKQDSNSISLAKALQRRLNKSGHQVLLFNISTKVGELAKQCQKDNRKSSNQLKAMKLQKDTIYQDALEEFEANIALCKKYQHIGFELKIEKVSITKSPYNPRFQKMKGKLDYKITLLNSQSGEKEDSLPDKNILAFGASYDKQAAADKLENKLYDKAAVVITQGMNELFMNRGSRPVNNSDGYQYTVIIKGLSADRASRKKAKLVRNIIKKHYQVAAPKLDHRVSSESKKIYRIPVQQEVDLENVIDALYDEVERKGYHNTSIKMDQNRAIIVVFNTL